MNSNSVKYVFYIPAFNNISNGIALLWQAAHYFSKYRSVRVWQYEYGYASPIPSEYHHIEISDHPLDPTEIVIYPENIEGNPLRAARVCRYFMAKAYILNGAPVNYNDKEFIFAYSHAINDLLPQYNLVNENFIQTRKYLSEVKIPGKVTLYYGKCRLTNFSKDVFLALCRATKVEVITRFHPSSKHDLYTSIATSELFISVDPLSSLIYEATMLGTPTLIADPVFREEYENYNHALPGFYYSYADVVAGKDYKLAEKAHAEYIRELDKNPEKTENIIAEIEHFFMFKNANERVKALDRHDKEFYLRRWNCRPIVNVTSLRSAILWHIMKFSPIFFSILYYIYKGKINARRILQFITRRVALSLHPTVLDFYLSRRKSRILRKELEDIETGQVGMTIPSEKVIDVNKWIMALLWLF